MILSVENVRFGYSARPILKDITFCMERGMVLAVLGVNGAGKSTLLKCINRILHPQGGGVILDGHDVQRMSGTQVARHIGYAPQRFGDDQLSVFDAVMLGRKPHIRWAASERDFHVVEQILDLMGLRDLALRSVNELSGGEAQKVVIARAFAQEPRLLLLDEPVSNLDVKNQLEVMTLVTSTVKAKEMSAIIAIHDLNLALRFADRFLLLRDGKVHAIVPRDGITSDLIAEVYHVHAIVREVEGFPIVIPVNACKVSHKSERSLGSGLHVA